MNNRNFTFDFVRCVAVLCVITIHSSVPLTEYAWSGNADWFTKVFHSVVYSLMNCGVPLFVCLSGALLLGKDESFKKFFSKREKRILTPFLIWSVVVFTIFYLQGRKCSELSQFVPTFIYELFMKGVIGIYWYVYMIVGLYLMTPLLRKITLNATRKQMIYFMLLALVSVFIAQLLPNTRPTLIFHMDYLYLAMFVSGYVIVKYLNSSKAWTMISTIGFVVLLFSHCLYVYTDNKTASWYVLLNLGLSLCLFSILLNVRQLPPQTVRKVSFGQSRQAYKSPKIIMN